MIVCANCRKEIPFGDSYYIVGDNFLQMKYFESEESNRFCSHECVCEFLSVLEVPNDDSLSLSEALSLVPPEKNTNLLRIVAGVYPEDAEVNGESEPVLEQDENATPKMPGVKKRENCFGWVWDVTIDIAAGKILNWPQGTTAKTWYKTSDDCGLIYLGKKYEGYVPNFLQIWDEDCGDYIYIEILEDGTIKDWDAAACRKWLYEEEDFYPIVDSE